MGQIGENERIFKNFPKKGSSKLLPFRQQYCKYNYLHVRIKVGWSISRIGFSIIARGNSKYGKVSAAVCTYIYIGTRRFDSGADKAHGRHTAEPRMQASLRRATKPRMKTAHGIPATHVRAQNSNPNLILVGFKAAEVPRTPSGDNPPLAAASHALPQVRCTT